MRTLVTSQVGQRRHGRYLAAWATFGRAGSTTYGPSAEQSVSAQIGHLCAVLRDRGEGVKQPEWVMQNSHPVAGNPQGAIFGWFGSRPAEPADANFDLQAVRSTKSPLLNHPGVAASHQRRTWAEDAEPGAIRKESAGLAGEHDQVDIRVHAASASGPRTHERDSDDVRLSARPVFRGADDLSYVAGYRVGRCAHVNMMGALASATNVSTWCSGEPHW